jgi:hypothetical protein
MYDGTIYVENLERVKRGEDLGLYGGPPTTSRHPMSILCLGIPDPSVTRGGGVPVEGVPLGRGHGIFGAVGQGNWCLVLLMSGRNWC